MPDIVVIDTKVKINKISLNNSDNLYIIVWCLAQIFLMHLWLILQKINNNVRGWNRFTVSNDALSNSNAKLTDYIERNQDLLVLFD